MNMICLSFLMKCNYFQRQDKQSKHLVADGRYSYLETGSLISIKKNVKDILIPSEEMKVRCTQWTMKNYAMSQEIVRDC